MSYRVLLSCASAYVHADLYEPGTYPSPAEAQEFADLVMAASPGVEAYVVPTGIDAREVLHEKGWI